MTLLSGMLKIPNLPTSVCEFKSPLLEAGLGLQLMTRSYRGSAHWWARVLRQCASQVVHFSHNCRPLSFPSQTLYYRSILCKNEPGIATAIKSHFFPLVSLLGSYWPWWKKALWLLFVCLLLFSGWMETYSEQTFILSHCKVHILGPCLSCILGPWAGVKMNC